MSKDLKPTLTGVTVCAYLKRFPDTPSLTLAKKIYKENPEVFTNIEHVRSIIRDYRGQNGNDENKRASRNKQFNRPPGEYNPFKIPESDCTEWKPIHIKEKRGLLFSDSHFPYHDVVAVNAMLDDAVRRPKLDFILINGDGMDFYQLSRFVKDPRKRSLNDELNGWVEFLIILRGLFSSAKIYWKLGNHEERLEKYLQVKAPELLDMSEFRLGKIIEMRGVTNVQVIEKQIIYTGRLPVIHGHEFQSKATSAVNPSRGLFLKALSSGLVCHYHRTSSHSEKDINEKLMSAFSVGCLCGLHPEYALLNNWNHGFAYIDIDGQEFNIENMKIHKGKVYHD
jgi:predicted MPP superfamily phosphohydrolase